LRSCRTAIVGVGNVLMGDDGIGVHVIRALADSVPEDVDLIDAGTALHEAVYELKGYERVVLVDSVEAGDVPGSVYRMELAELLKIDGSTRALSLHEHSVVPTLREAGLAGLELGEVVLIGVEPCRVEWGLDLSPELRARLPVVIEAVMREASPVCVGAERTGVDTDEHNHQ